MLRKLLDFWRAFANDPAQVRAAIPPCGFLVAMLGIMLAVLLPQLIQWLRHL